MLFAKHPAKVALFIACLLVSLTSCAKTPTSDALERSLAADPKLKNNPVTLGQPSPTGSQNQTAKLPDDFPAEIPKYPQAQLQEVTPANNQIASNQPSAGNSGYITRWTTTDPSNLVQNYYQKEFQANNWEILTQPTENSQGSTSAPSLIVRKNDLRVTVSIQSAQNSNPSSVTPSPNQTPSSNSENATEFVIEYTRGTAQASSSNSTEAAKPSDNTTKTTSLVSTSSEAFTDINKAPQEFRSYIQDLAALGVLNTSTDGNKSASSTQFEPNKVITRREYVRWLVAANNQMHANTQGKQIRLASDSSQPAFQDIPRNDPDFAAIQGLAEAGLIPSALTGDATAVLFRPEAPLTRENLILWKVPLDTRQGLPNASLDAVKQTWGFQDAAKINPKALRAVLADFQNGDSANIHRLVGYTTIFQPQKPVTRAEAAAVLSYFGSQGEGIAAKDALQLKQQQSQPQPAATPQPSPASTTTQ